MDLVDEAQPAAELEDAWEAEVRRLLRAEGPSDSAAAAGDATHGRETFRKSVKLAIAELTRVLNEEHVDMVARGKALWKLVEEERLLAEKEAAERMDKPVGGTERDGRPGATDEEVDHAGPRD
jgi:hypothetical protein